MNKFTPGKWNVNNSTITAKENDLLIFAESVANAHLMAAAPDLLEAIEQSFDFPADFFECEETDAVTITVTGRHLRMVKSAIAKARGES